MFFFFFFSVSMIGLAVILGISYSGLSSCGSMTSLNVFFFVAFDVGRFFLQ